jgi:CheY-like chemotaxis protein
MSTERYILVADDDPLVLRSITFILEKNGFPVRAASDGAQALALAQEEKPTLALLDVMMPKMDGLEVCEKIKADPELTDVPVFLVTARAMSAERERGLAAGADEYITKPFVNKDLIDRVHAIFDRAVC